MNDVVRVLRIVCLLGWTMLNQPNVTLESINPDELTREEAAPLLAIVARLHDVQRVKGSAFGDYRAVPHVCWLMSQEAKEGGYRELGFALSRYRGAAQWFLGADHPRMCIFAQPRSIKNTLAEFRSQVVADIPRLAAYLENSRINLSSKVGKVEDEFADAYVDEIIDFREAHDGSIFLVRDPRAFHSSAYVLTAATDRVLHFGLTENEREVLYRVVHADSGGEEGEYDVIARFADSHNDQIVLPTDVSRLLMQCERLRRRSLDEVSSYAVSKITWIGQSAARLGSGVLAQSHRSP